jgi:hypothetical protein
MTANPSAKLRGFIPSGASWLLSFTLCLGALLLVAGQTQAGDLTQDGQITLNPSTSPVILTLQGPDLVGTAGAAYGLTLTYHDGSSTDPTGIAVFKLYRPSGQYQWLFSAGDGGDRPAMKLNNDHSLTFFDPLDSTRQIVITPGPNGTAGISINGQRLLTSADAAGTYLHQQPNFLAVGPNATLSNPDLGLPPAGLLAIGGDAWGSCAIALGNGSHATGQGAFASGASSLASGSNSVAIGQLSLSNSPNSMALGFFSAAVGEGSTALGSSAGPPACDPPPWGITPTP